MAFSLRALVALLVLFPFVACGDDAASDGAVPDVGPDVGPIDAALDGASDADASPVGETFWIADDGDDAAEGSEGAPFATFSHAIAGLAPGDTLIAKSGSVFGRLLYDCSDNNSCDGAPCPSGERGRPITVRAETPRGVELSTLEEAVIVRQCSHIVIDGFEAHQRDEMTESYSNIALVVGSDHVTVRNMLLHSLNRWPNGHVMYFSRSRHVLFEDSEIYDFHRGGVIISSSEHVTVRRVYINGRDTPNLPDPAFNCCCLEDADYGVHADGSFDVTVENTIVERVCNPFNVYAQNTDLADRGGKAARILGSVALASPGTAFSTRSYCETASPCPEANRTRNVEMVDCVAVESEDGFHLESTTDGILRNVTAIDSRTDDFEFDVATDNAAVTDASFLVVNALDLGVGLNAYEIINQAAATIVSSNSFGNDTLFDPEFDVPPGHGTADPLLGGCYVYVPDTSPMRGAGAGGLDIGARIVNRYVDGVLTDEPLWDPATGAFPCGAVVEGVNDEATFPGMTCSTVHERLHVGSSGCALP